jgi:HD-like signal output (HDOD) protein
MLLLVVVCAGVSGVGVWWWRRRSRAKHAAADVAAESAARPAADDPAAAQGSAAQPDAAPLPAANSRASQRLWNLAFASVTGHPAATRADGPIRENIVALLQVDTLDARLFPRRPALLPQLLHAVNDPGAAADKLARIVAHDPVLTADVLRLANTSLYRLSPAPIETIQRAIVVCGVDGLRGMLATSMLRPAFRASAKNFPRLPRMLWERTERAARAAELLALHTGPQDRFEAQLVVLLSALGPLVVYGAVLDVYSRNPHVTPSGALFVDLIGELAPGLSLHIAREWQSSARLLAALDGHPDEPLTAARHVGELFGTVSLLESQTIISRDERLRCLGESGLPAALVESLWEGMHGHG